MRLPPCIVSHSEIHKFTENSLKRNFHGKAKKGVSKSCGGPMPTERSPSFAHTSLPALCNLSLTCFPRRTNTNHELQWVYASLITQGVHIEESRIIALNGFLLLILTIDRIFWDIAKKSNETVPKTFKNHTSRKHFLFQSQLKATIKDDFLIPHTHRTSCQPQLRLLFQTA